MIDARGPAAVVLEGVRVRNIYGSALYSSEQGGLYLGAKGCEFLGGAWHGSFDQASAVYIHGDCVALFEDCIFSDLGAALGSQSHRAVRRVASFERCTFENTRLAHHLVLRSPELVDMRVAGAKVRFGPEGQSPDERLALWGVQACTEARAVDAGPGIVRCTVGDLLNVMERVSLGPMRRVAGVRLVEMRRGAPELFLVTTCDERGSHSRTSLYRYRNSTLQLVDTKNRLRSFEGRTPQRVDVPSSMATILRRGGIDPQREAYGVKFEQRHVDKAYRPVVRLVGRDMRAIVDVLAETGAALPKR